MKRNPIFAVSPSSPALTETRARKWSVISRYRSKPHLARKFYHMVMGLICFSLYAFVLNRSQALFVLGLVGGTWVIADILRLRSPVAYQWGLKLFGNLMRREELKSLTGNTFYILGLTCITLFFPKPVVLLSVLYLALGDPIAAIVGCELGKTKIFGKKSLEGALANFTVCGLATGLFASLYLGLAAQESILLTGIGGAIAAFVELLPLPVDDNFTIPVISAILLSFLPFL